MRNGACAKLSPKRIALFRVQRLRHAHTVAKLDRHCVPYKFSACRKRHIAHIISVPCPRFSIFCLVFLCFFRFFLRYDKYRFFGIFLRFVPTFLLLCGQHVLDIRLYASCADYVVAWHGNAKVVVAKIKRKLARPQKLFVLPARYIAVFAHTRKKLRHRIKVVFVFLKILIAASAAYFHTVVDIIRPLYFKNKGFACCQRLRHIHAHHRFIDGKRQIFIICIVYKINFKATVIIAVQAFYLARISFFVERACSCKRSIAFFFKNILV